MALDQKALLNLHAQLGLTAASERIRVTMDKLHQELIDAEAVAFIGAAPFERSYERTGHRDGSRPWTLTKTAGDLDLSIPTLRQGTFSLAPVRCLASTSVTPRIWPPGRCPSARRKPVGWVA